MQTELFKHMFFQGRHLWVTAWVNSGHFSLCNQITERDMVLDKPLEYSFIFSEFQKKQPEAAAFLKEAFDANNWIGPEGFLEEDDDYVWKIKDIKRVLSVDFDKENRKLEYKLQLYGNNIITGVIEDQTTCECCNICYFINYKKDQVVS